MPFDPQRLIGARKNAGLSIAEAARRAGISKSGWWEVEAGHNDPRASTLDAMAAVLGLSAAALFDCGAGTPLAPWEREVLAHIREARNKE